MTKKVLRLSIACVVVLCLGSCGGGGGSSTTSQPSPPTPSQPSPVASVTVSPGDLTLVVRESRQLTAVTRDQAGNPLDGRPVTWATSDQRSPPSPRPVVWQASVRAPQRSRPPRKEGAVAPRCPSFHPH